MANLMQRGAAWLGDRIKVAAGRAVTITQGSKVLTNITAALVMHEHDVIGDEGFLTKVQSCDWTLAAADLGDLTLRAGAMLEIVETGDKYEAMPIGKKPCVEPKDGSGVLLTLHTKKVSC